LCVQRGLLVEAGQLVIVFNFVYPAQTIVSSNYKTLGEMMFFTYKYERFIRRCAAKRARLFTPMI
jgi:hypothetical protein